MTDQDQVKDIEDVLAVVEASAKGERVTIEDMLDVIGQRAYGPVLLTMGLVGVSPVGAVPGLPTVMASIIFLISAQIIVSPRSLWLPRFLTRRSVERRKLEKSVALLRRPAHVIDKFIRPRLTVLTHGPATIVIGITCMFLSVLVPFIELMPFAGLLAAAAFVAFGLALTAHDGVLAAAAFGLTCTSVYLVILILT